MTNKVLAKEALKTPFMAFVRAFPKFTKFSQFSKSGKNMSVRSKSCATSRLASTCSAVTGRECTNVLTWGGGTPFLARTEVSFGHDSPARTQVPPSPGKGPGTRNMGKNLALGYLLACEQTDTSENITFPILRMRAVPSCLIKFIECFQSKLSWEISTLHHSFYTNRFCCCSMVLSLSVRVV